MKSRRLLAFLAIPMLLGGLGAAPTTQSNDPHVIRSGEVWLDTAGKPITAHGGGILVHEGTYYWFGEHYGPVVEKLRAERGVRCYRSRDLANWEDLGNVLQVVSDPNSSIQVGSVIERPKVLFNQKTGKFVMWFHNELRGRGYGAAQAGVAVADRVEGPYKLVRSGRGPKEIWPVNVRPVGAAATRPSTSFEAPAGLPVVEVDLQQKKYERLSSGFTQGQESRDMTVFQDDDGKAYHLYSSEMNMTLHIAELTDDYLDYTGRYARAFPEKQREAPAPFKHAGKYYMITSGCTGWAPNPADIAVADSIWGPWKVLGNPWQGDPAKVKTSWDSQSTYVLKVGEGKYLYMGDRWRPKDLDASPYIWAPIEFDGEKATIRIRPEWDIRELTGKGTSGE